MICYINYLSERQYTSINTKDYREIHYKKVRKARKARKVKKAREIRKAAEVEAKTTKCKNEKGNKNRYNVYLQLISNYTIHHLTVLVDYLTVIVDTFTEQLDNA
jgi:hypothetical protein